jgi:hypothetical protein
VKETFNEALESNLDLTEMTNQNFEVCFLEARDKAQFLTLEMNAIFANLRKSEMALNLEFKVEILNANQQINQVHTFFYFGKIYNGRFSSSYFCLDEKNSHLEEFDILKSPFIPHNRNDLLFCHI